VTGSFEVVLVKGKEGVTVYADKESLEHIKTAVTNDILNIYMEGKHNAKGNIKIEVSYESMSLVALNGSGDITTNGKIETQNLKVALIGSGDVTLNIETENIKANLDGSGDLKLEGKTTNFKADVVGSGDLEANKLKAENVQVKVVGSGDASVYASAAIKANVEGSGDITYDGNPTAESTNVSGSGSIDKK
jgi:putative autotransporter adhesin-like protein